MAKEIVTIVMEIEHDNSSTASEMKVGLKLYLERAEPDDYGVSNIKVKTINFERLRENNES